MKDNNELKEKINKEFETPEIPFNEWAKARSIFDESDVNGAVTYSVTELAGNVSGRSITSVNPKKIAIWSTIITFIIVVAVILGTILPRNNSAPLLPEIYGANDSISAKIDLEEVTSKEDIYLFDMSMVVQTEDITKDILTQDNTNVLLYTIYQCLLSVERNGSFDAFYITYRIRTYKNYEFYNYESYFELDKIISVNNFKINYKIVQHNNVYAYAKFADNNYEYFIEACGFQNLTVLNEENFFNLLDKILV